MIAQAPPPPLVSVVMGVHDGEQFLGEAVDSILAQSFTRFELIVVDDGSTDGTGAILDSYEDPRLKIVRQAHAGLAAALNSGVASARAHLIARMDADDISEPERLQAQHEFMVGHQRVALLGTAVRVVSEAGAELGIWRPPTDHATIRRRMIGANQFAHPSVMFRRNVFLAVGGYRTDMRFAQDYDLWLRFVPRFETANLDRALVIRRVGPDQFGTPSESRQIRWALRARLAALLRGDYPLGDATGLLRPLIAALTPGPLRQRLRRLFLGDDAISTQMIQGDRAGR